MVGLLGEGKMDRTLEAEIEQIVDRQLQELGFIDLCTRIAHKVVEKVQKIDEEHSLVKHELNNIEQKINLFFEKKPAEKSKDVIVIEEDEEKPLVERLHAISKSPSSISLTINTKDELTTPVKQLSMMTGRFPQTPSPKQTNTNTDINRNVETENQTSKIPESSRENFSAGTKRTSDLQSSVSIGPKRMLDGENSHQKSIETSDMMLNMPIGLKRTLAEDSAHRKSIDSESDVAKSSIISESHGYHSSQMTIISKSPIAKTVLLAKSLENEMPLMSKVAASAGSASRINQPLLEAKNQNVTDDNIESQLAPKIKIKLKPGRKPKHETILARKNASNSPALSDTDPLDTTVRRNSRPVITTGSPNKPLQLSEISEYTSSGQDSSKSASPFVVTQGKSQGAKTADQEIAKNLTTAKRGVHKFKEGDRVLAKQDKSDIWYEGTISKTILNKYGQEKFQVRFDHGHKMHGTIPVNNLALLVNPESDDLNVGSRIVAARPKDTVDARIAKKYISLASLSKSKEDILFGGIVVERACEDNKNRFLVFFDDGFAQYLTVKKMHHVIHAAEKVWEDVSINCREFIKEYLEEYPDRPMVKLKSTLSIQTEWNGRWLQARVISVDGSLVKMLFDIDRRTEWIYRGSTRLEPLYSELERRDLEALKAKAKKPGRKKKSTSQTKKVEPYIDDDITKPCYGHSKYSLTDPTGMLQRNFWDPIMEATAKKAATSEVTEEPDYSIPETDPKSVSSVTSIESSEPDCTPGPLKIAFNFDKRKTATATTSKSSFQATKHALKRKLDDSSGHDSDGSADVTNFDKSKKRGTDEDPSGIKSPSKYSSNSPNHRSSLHRQSSHSSIDSHYSDSQSKHSSHSDNQSKSSSYIRGRLERQSSNTSMSTNQSARSLSRSRRPSSTSSNQSNAENQSQAIPDVSSVKSPKSLVKQIEYLVRPVEVVSRKRGSSLERYLIAMTNKSPLSKSQTGLASETASPFQQMFEQQTKQMSMRVASQSHPKMRGSHDCTSSCGSDVFIPFHERKLHNPLSIPLLLGWTRETAKRRPGYHRDIYYRSPCNKRLRNMAEVTKYLLQNNITNVSIDQFSFDSSVSCRDQLRFVETPRVHFDDISCGREAFPIQCVNEKSDEQPPLIEYISKRIVGDDIKLDMDPGFLACCDCKDFCQDKSKCACARVTIDTSDAIDGKKDENCGYLYRRVKECVTTGIYECNQNCSCSSSCYNRVVQNGIGLRLQIFMTNHKGWGVRCLDDIPRGTFICTYTGQILNEEMADKEGTDFGDEYLAELDHIEVVEQAKDGYESDVPELKNEKRSYNRVYSENSNKESDSDDESEFAYSTSSECSDNAKNATYAKEETTDMELPSEAKDERPQSAITLGKPLGDVIDLTLDSDNEDETDASRQDNTTNVTTSNDVCEPSDANKQASLQQMIQSLRTRLASDKVSSSKSSDATPRSCREESKVLHQTGSHRVLAFQSPASINETVESSENDVKQTFPEATSEDGKANIKDISKPDPCSTAADVAYDKGIDYDADAELRKAAAEVVPHLRKAVARKSSMSILQMLVSRKAKCDVDGNEKQLKEAMNASSLERVVNADVSLATCSKTFTSPRSSTGGYFARKLTSMRPQITPPTQTDVEKTETENKNGTRSLYGEDHCYVIDAKSFGNVGRYLNHSCMPNLFVQNVFVDTHDLRFPLVAFFAQQNIPAMTELTWDYSYDVGSVPGKVLICCCGALECRGRLL